ncbi:MAG TPA: NmrA family NAD(P)-binding protein [Leifsonia sp.]
MIVVAGGSGLLGRHLVADLLGAGESVRVLVRDTERAHAMLGNGVEVVGGDVRRREGLDQAVAGARVVISAVHGLVGGRGAGPVEVDERGNGNLIDAAAAASADVVLVSVCGASADHPVDLFRAKWAAEQHLLASGTPGTIVRAPAYLETWLGILAATAGASGRPLVFGRGDEPVRFVSAVDVAGVVSRAATDPALRGRMLQVAGEAITLSALARALQDARGWHGELRHVPRPLLRALSVLARPLNPVFARENRVALAMDTGVFGDGPADPFPLGGPTRSIAEVLDGMAVKTSG